MRANLEVILRNSDAATRADDGTRSRTSSVITPGQGGKGPTGIACPAEAHKNGREEFSIDQVHTTEHQQYRCQSSTYGKVSHG